MRTIKKMIMERIIYRVIIGILVLIIMLLTIGIITIHKKVKATEQEMLDIKQEITTEVPETTEDIETLKQQEFNNKNKELQNIEDNMERFVAYKQLCEEYSEWIDVPKTIYDCYTDNEIKLIQKVVETETYQACFDAKVNVACVVFNRVDSDRFPDTVTKVVKAPNQFAYGRSRISDDTILAVEYAFMFGDTTKGALFFHSGKKTKAFNRAQYIFTDKAGHHFYR